MHHVAVILLNYRSADLTIEALGSLEAEVAEHRDRVVVVVDNASGDGSADAIASAIRARGWSGWARLVRSSVNGGFAAGNNLGIQSVESGAYLLLNSDARATPGLIDDLCRSLDERPEVGLVGPRLEGADGAPQVSCFRFRSPLSELLAAAGTGALDRLARGGVVALGLPARATEAPWISFACVLIRREVIQAIGLLDDGYFMYFEDIDYCRRARRAGWRVLHEPRARAVHLRGASSTVKSAMAARARVPRYYYESRSRYFAKFYGGAAGLVLANGLWLVGRSFAAARELAGTKDPHACRGEWRDNWTNWTRPLRRPAMLSGASA